ncbi:MAG: hypothetical protein FWB96_01385 [Defluviitaleaceae bacterium]|nr:hypothetical protein [Defluviitaleaceae bacterium]MCL2261654.1 hypothetical protein [Defluviitaleaceae bacterium]
MRAILEMPVPESCATCFLGEPAPGYNRKQIRCYVKYHSGNPVGTWQGRSEASGYDGEGRAPFCPLKIVPTVIAAAIVGHEGGEEQTQNA